MYELLVRILLLPEHSWYARAHLVLGNSSPPQNHGFLLPPAESQTVPGPFSGTAASSTRDDPALPVRDASWEAVNAPGDRHYYLCPGDSGALPAGPGQEAPGFPGPLDLHRMDVDLCIPDGLAMVRRSWAFGITRRVRGKIGRASCRERV